MRSSLIVLALFLWARAAGADAEGPGCGADGSHVTVEFSELLHDAARAAVLSDLRAALAPQNIDVCLVEGAPAEKSLAFISLTAQTQDVVRVVINDRLTAKTVSRDIDLSSADEGAAPLIIAVGVDELLRATWAELSLRKTEPEKDASAREQPREPVPPKPAPPQVLPRHRFALGASADVYLKGSNFFGSDLSYGSHIADAVEWTVFAGPRFGKERDASSLGSAQAEAVSFGATLQVPVVRTEGFVFGPSLSLAGTHAWFQGEPAPGEADVVAGEFSGFGVVLRGGLSLRLHLGSLFFGVQTSAGAPLLALEITDGQEVIAGITGLEWSNSLAVGWSVSP